LNEKKALGIEERLQALNKPAGELALSDLKNDLNPEVTGNESANKAAKKIET
jgi:hypothetical protein